MTADINIKYLQIQWNPKMIYKELPKKNVLLDHKTQKNILINNLQCHPKTNCLLNLELKHNQYTINLNYAKKQGILSVESRMTNRTF